MLTDEQGASLVRLARTAISSYLANSSVVRAPGDLKFKAGVFVTLNYLTRNGAEHLRGCIGFTRSDRLIAESVVEAAIASATSDPRFPAVDLVELRNIIVEVSVLTPPAELPFQQGNARELVKIGRDGLMIDSKYGSGLLLPQVPVELGWSIEDYLTNLCYKAGTGPEALSDPSTRLFSFQAIIFKELEPAGRVSRLNL